MKEMSNSSGSKYHSEDDRLNCIDENIDSDTSKVIKNELLILKLDGE